MPQPTPLHRYVSLGGLFLAMAAHAASAQTTNFALRIARGLTNVTVAWTNRGTLRTPAARR